MITIFFNGERHEFEYDDTTTFLDVLEHFKITEYEVEVIITLNNQIINIEDINSKIKDYQNGTLYLTVEMITVFLNGVRHEFLYNDDTTFVDVLKHFNIVMIGQGNVQFSELEMGMRFDHYDYYLDVLENREMTINDYIEEVDGSMNSQQYGNGILDITVVQKKSFYDYSLY